MSASYESSAAFFEAKYRQTADPWDFVSDPYELCRYDAILAALSHRRYRQAFEPGCSVGVLTAKLAGICDAVEAVDFSPTSVERARERCVHLPGVRVSCRSFAERMPVENFDLIVLSEIGYYFEPREWGGISARLIAAMVPGTTLLAAHWLGYSSDHRMNGDRVHEILSSNLLSLQHSERHDAFRLDRWVRV